MLLPKLLLPETDQAQAGFHRAISVPRPLLEPRHPLHQIAEVSLEGITSPRNAPVDERLENASRRSEVSRLCCTRTNLGNQGERFGMEGATDSF